MTKNGAFPPDFYMLRQSLFLLHSPNQQISIAALTVEKYRYLSAIINSLLT